MPRIRTIKPNLWEDPAFCDLSDVAKLAYLNRITQSDDAGRFLASPVAVAASMNPVKPPTTRRVAKALEELAEHGLIVLYDANGGSYGCFPTWSKHQRINRPSPPIYPAPPGDSVRRSWPRLVSDSVNDSVSRSLNDSVNDSRSHSTPDRKGREEDKEEEGSVRGGGASASAGGAPASAPPSQGASKVPSLDEDDATRTAARRIMYGQGGAP